MALIRRPTASLSKQDQGASTNCQSPLAATQADEQPRDRTGSIRVLAISGSLRHRSSNTALIGAAARLTPKAVDLSIYAELGELPPFNPDVGSDDVPAAVTRFRAALQACDAVLISSPEYAHGVPGVLKNALDWVVGTGELIDKPIALINSSARATRAWASLKDTLTVMSARVITGASITIPLEGGRLDTASLTCDPSVSAALRLAIGALVFAALEGRPSSVGP